MDTDEENDAMHDAIRLGSRTVLRDNSVLSKKSTWRAVVMVLLPNRKYRIYWVGYSVTKKLSVVPTARHTIDSLVDPLCYVKISELTRLP